MVVAVSETYVIDVSMPHTQDYEAKIDHKTFVSTLVLLQNLLHPRHGIRAPSSLCTLAIAYNTPPDT